MPFLTTDDARWDETLQTLPHDFYHLPGYAATCAAEHGSRPLAFLYRRQEHAALVPVLVRAIPGTDRLDAISPYGYASPVFSPDAPEPFQRDAMEAYLEAGREAGWVTSLLRLHPVLQPRLPELDGCRVQEHGPTVVLDLREDTDVWWTSVRANQRRTVSRLRADGFTVRFDDPADDEAFRRLYAETMARVGAGAAYAFSDPYFNRLAEALGPRLLRATVVAPDGAVAAAGLFALTNGLGAYHLGATADAFVRRSPTALLFVEVHRELARRGGVRLHLGGGVGAQRDSLYAFKRRFGGTEGVFATARVVHLPADYRALCAAQEDEPHDTFFPRYRRVG